MLGVHIIFHAGTIYSQVELWIVNYINGKAINPFLQSRSQICHTHKTCAYKSLTRVRRKTLILNIVPHQLWQLCI